MTSSLHRARAVAALIGLSAFAIFAALIHEACTVASSPEACIYDDVPEPHAPALTESLATAARAALTPAEPIPFQNARLFTVDLPAGNVQGFSIDFPNWSGHTSDRKFRSSTWLRDSDGDGKRDYDGILLRGKGAGVTNIVRGPADATVLIERHAGLVVIQDATIHAGASQGVFSGLEHPGLPAIPSFGLHLVRAPVVSDPPVGTSALIATAPPRGPPVDDVRSSAIHLAAERVVARAQVSGLDPLRMPGPRWLTPEEQGVFQAYVTWIAPARSEGEEGAGAAVARSSAALTTTTKWGVFTYQCDVVVRGSTFDLAYSAEHVLYMHGFAHDGLHWQKNAVLASGAEQIKLTNRPWEADWVPTARALITDSTFTNWYQPWSWRGGAGIVDQGAGIDLTVLRCSFQNIGPAGTILSSNRARAIMVDDGGDNDGNGVQDFYSAADLVVSPGTTIPAGTPGRGFANGNVTVDDCLAYTGPGNPDLSIQIRVGKNGPGSWFAARSFHVTDSGLYGDHVQIQLGGVYPGGTLVSGCNTPSIAEQARAQGVNTTSQTKIPLSAWPWIVDASVGLTQ